MQYFGGGVLNHTDVTNMYLGDYFATSAGSADAKKNDAFMSDLVQNKNMVGLWNQYGVGAGTTEGSVKLGGSYKSGQKITQGQIETMLQQAISSGKVNPGDQSIYNFVLPPGAVLATSDGTTSTQGLGGFHGSIHTPDGKEVFYSANAFSHGSNGIDFTGKGDGIDNVTITESHEISEAVTDPHVQDAIDTNDYGKLGWMDVTTNSGEIGDVEVNDASPGTPLDRMYGSMDGFYVQKIWSQKDGQNETSAVNASGGISSLPKPAPAPNAQSGSNIDDGAFEIPNAAGKTTGWGEGGDPDGD
jgi:hypothetical protein